jgi:uncharacterized protein YndB with AHSA1/START domain
MLKLRADGFQFIQETPIDAPPAKVWKSLLDVRGWWGFGPVEKRPKVSFAARAGGQWRSQAPDGTEALHATVTYMEPGKLLRMQGQMGLTHLPVTSVIIFELQPRGKGTLLRMAQRTYGFMDAGVKKRYQGGWKQILPQIKQFAETGKRC